MAEVLDEACRAFGVQRDTYGLKQVSLGKNPVLQPTATSGRLTDDLRRYKNKVIDTALPFRLTNLPNGAKLDLVVKSKSTGVVQVALNLPTPYNGRVPPNGRILKKFPSTFTIWQVLRQFEESDEAKKAKLNITDRGAPPTGSSGAGQLCYEAPVLSAMGRTLEGFQVFQQTLAQLGYNQGSVLMHLAFKQTNTTLAAAMEDISKHFKDTNTTTQIPEGNQSTTKDEPSSSKEPAVAAPEIPTGGQQPPLPAAESMDLDGSPGNSIEASPPPPSAPSASPRTESASGGEGITLQPIHIYQAPSSSTPAAAHAPFVESDFIPTVSDVQRLQSSLQKESLNKRLLSDKELHDEAAAHDAKIAAVRTLEVRARFPDNTAALYQVTQNTTAAELYAGVRAVMADSKRGFKLLLPPHTVIREDGTQRLIKTYQLTGKGVVVSLVWDDASQAGAGTPFLKESAAIAAEQIPVPNIPEGKEEKILGRAGGATTTRSGSGEGSSASDQLKKLGKFFKLPGKK
jgi:tether containing UBX domain for GLUT4